MTTACGVELGAVITAVVVAQDAAPAVVLPEDLEAALAADPAARAAFDALAQSRRKEAARSVAEAKRPETRAKRLAALLEGLRS